jgi:hypothetical protein
MHSEKIFYLVPPFTRFLPTMEKTGQPQDAASFVCLAPVAETPSDKMAVATVTVFAQTTEHNNTSVQTSGWLLPCILNTELPYKLRYSFSCILK